MSSPQLAQPFPDFTIETLSTKQAKANGPLFVIVWRTDCPTCKLMLPFVDRMAKQYRAATIAGIAQASKDETSGYVTTNEITAMSNYADPHLTTSSFLGVQVVPAYWLVGRDGKVSASGVGWDREKIESIAKALSTECGVAYSPLITKQDEVPNTKPG